MMDYRTDKLVSAIGDIDTAYLEEAIAAPKQAERGFAISPNYLPRVWQCWSYWACP